MPLAPPSLLSGLITSVISKPGPGCECGAAPRGGGWVSVPPSHRRPSVRVPPAYLLQPRGCPAGVKPRGGVGAARCCPSATLWCVPCVPQPPSPGLGVFPVNPPRPDTKPLSLCLTLALVEEMSRPVQVAVPAKSISWESCCWGELSVDLGAGNTRCLPRAAQGKPYFLSEAPSGPEALSPGAGETDPGGAAAAAAEGGQGSATPVHPTLVRSFPLLAACSRHPGGVEPCPAAAASPSPHPSLCRD